MACLAQCGGLLVVHGTAVGRSDRLFQYQTRTENIEHFQQRVMSRCTVCMISARVVATRNSSRNLAPIHLSYSQNGSSPGLWLIDGIQCSSSLLSSGYHALFSGGGCSDRDVKMTTPIQCPCYESVAHTSNASYDFAVLAGKTTLRQVCCMFSESLDIKFLDRCVFFDFASLSPFINDSNIRHCIDCGLVTASFINHK